MFPGPARPLLLGRSTLPPGAPGRALAGSAHVQSSLSCLLDLQRQILAVSAGRLPAHGQGRIFLDVLTPISIQAMCQSTGGPSFPREDCEIPAGPRFSHVRMRPDASSVSDSLGS